MDFSIVIPSRNRPVLLRQAIESVLKQTHDSFEVLVVNDGSDGANEQAYIELAASVGERVRFIHLEQSRNGHGPSGATNRGADLAQGDYICFLDDDDYWTDADHLQRAYQCLQLHADADVYFANQKAFLNDAPVPGPIWLEPLEQKVQARGTADKIGSYPASLDQLMACPGFCHLNTTIVSRSLYARIGGMDENIRYENDLDFYLRVIDNAHGIRFYPGIVSRHNVPDTSKALNASTALSQYRKMLFRAYVWDKALLFSQSSLIKRTAARNKSYALKTIATLLAQEKRFTESFFYARQATAFGLNLKWTAYCCYLGLRAAIQ